jgi:hypothetical protein
MLHLSKFRRINPLRPPRNNSLDAPCPYRGQVRGAPPAAAKINHVVALPGDPLA